MECKVYSVKCGVERQVQSVKCGVDSVKWKV